MMFRTGKRLVVGAVVTAAMVAGCADRPESELGESDTAAIDVDALAERYPRIAPDPLPPPEPSLEASAEPPPGLPADVQERITGGATYYADHFEGRRTASGIPFRQNQMVAAHRAYPFGTILRVTNLNNDRSVNVRVVDRGPFGSSARARATIIDLSRRAAEQLGFISAGRAEVAVEVLEWGPGLGG